MTGTNILIVEDNLIIALDLQEKLESIGYNITDIVSTGEQAIAKSKALEPDLIIMDVGLKGEMNGIEATKKIHETHDIPVLYMTGNRDMLVQSNIKAPTINKPYNDAELETVLAEMLERGS